jgi:hypothetical protein
MYTSRPNNVSRSFRVTTGRSNHSNRREVIAIGRRSGAERQILITYVDDGAPAIIGTNAGRDRDPAWANNLRSHPEVSARWGGH